VDLKVGIAVFATLLVIALAMTGDDTFNVGDISDETETSEQTNIPTSISDILGQFSEPPEANETVKAEIQTSNLNEKIVDVNSANVTGQNMTQVEADGQEIQTQTPLTIKNLTGTLQLQPLQIEGQAQGYNSENIQNIGSQQINVQTPLEDIQIIENNNIDIQLENTTGKVQTETETQLDETDIEISAFSGDMTIHPNNETLILDGLYHGITAGDATFGY